MTKQEAKEYLAKFFEKEMPVINDNFYENLLQYILDSEEGPQFLVPCNKKGKYQWDESE